MRADEFPEWKAGSVESYSADMQENGGMPRDAADAKAISDFDRLLTQGVETPEHSVHVIEEDGSVVGYLWLALRDSPSLGRAAMEFAERFAAEQGLGRIELNVMGGNDVARGLYRALGYDDVAVYMGKTL
jgi:GNAT superfamily N-acetyltransferase